MAKARLESTFLSPAFVRTTTNAAETAAKTAQSIHILLISGDIQAKDSPKKRFQKFSEALYKLIVNLVGLMFCGSQFGKKVSGN